MERKGFIAEFQDAEKSNLPPERRVHDEATLFFPKTRQVRPLFALWKTPKLVAPSTRTAL
jgi:hypothetical protein